MQPRAESDAKELADGASPLTSFVFTAADPNPASPFVRLCHNLLIPAHCRNVFYTPLRCVISTQLEASATQDFGTRLSRHPRRTTGNAERTGKCFKLNDLEMAIPARFDVYSLYRPFPSEF